jgi:cation diffusion facilitator CzcD-associated flavoprotein CzcO
MRKKNFMATSPAPRYRVLIIGAGISGIAAACQLKEKLGMVDLLVLEQQDGVGVG